MQTAGCGRQTHLRQRDLFPKNRKGSKIEQVIVRGAEQSGARAECPRSPLPRSHQKKTSKFQCLASGSLVALGKRRLDRRPDCPAHRTMRCPNSKTGSRFESARPPQLQSDPPRYESAVRVAFRSRESRGRLRGTSHATNPECCKSGPNHASNLRNESRSESRVPRRVRTTRNAPRVGEWTPERLPIGAVRDGRAGAWR